MYDRVVDVPREQAWFGDVASRPDASPWLPELAATRDALETLTGIGFRYVLVNRYRDGSDSVAWHNDREVAHMVRPVIASLTLGATRAFDLRPKSDRRRIVSVDLDHGDLVIMRGDTQANYEHRVAKDRRVTGERINLTFREMREPDERAAIEQEFDTGDTKDGLR
jgi:alkylated DNA repair dioxygenase AlkB